MAKAFAARAEAESLKRLGKDGRVQALQAELAAEREKNAALHQTITGRILAVPPAPRCGQGRARGAFTGGRRTGVDGRRAERRCPYLCRGPTCRRWPA